MRFEAFGLIRRNVSIYEISRELWEAANAIRQSLIEVCTFQFVSDLPSCNGFRLHPRIMKSKHMSEFGIHGLLND